MPEEEKRHKYQIYCLYIKNKHNYVSGCGLRAPYNKHWKYCPYCGRPINKIWNIKEDERN